MCKKNIHLHIYRNTLVAVQEGSQNRLNERLDFPRHHRQSGKHLDVPTNGMVTDPPLERDRIDRILRSNMKLGNYRMCLTGCNLSHVCPVCQGNPKENFRATKSSMWIRGSPEWLKRITGWFEYCTYVCYYWGGSGVKKNIHEAIPKLHPKWKPPTTCCSGEIRNG